MSLFIISGQSLSFCLYCTPPHEMQQSDTWTQHSLPTVNQHPSAPNDQAFSTLSEDTHPPVGLPIPKPPTNTVSTFQAPAHSTISSSADSGQVMVTVASSSSSGHSTLHSQPFQLQPALLGDDTEGQPL